MKQNPPSTTIRISFRPATLKQIEQLGRKTGLNRNNVIRYAVTKLAEREGIPIRRRKLG